MSYFHNLNTKTEIIASLIKLGTPTATAVGGRFTLSGYVNGSVSVVSNRLRLVAGSSYYIEASPLIQQTNANGTIVFGVYDSGTSTYLHSCSFTFGPTVTRNTAQISRTCTSALILDADISTSMDVEIRIETLTGTGWNMTIQADGIAGYNFVGYPSLRLLELPS